MKVMAWCLVSKVTMLRAWRWFLWTGTSGGRASLSSWFGIVPSCKAWCLMWECGPPPEPCWGYWRADSPDPWSLLLLLFWLKLLNSEVTSSPSTLQQFSTSRRTSSHTYEEKQHTVTKQMLSLAPARLRTIRFNCFTFGSSCNSVGVYAEAICQESGQRWFTRQLLSFTSAQSGARTHKCAKWKTPC